MDNLLEAIIYGDISYVKWILKFNIDINTPDSNKITYLHYACFYGHLNIVQELINNFANVNAKDIKGYTPLYCASYSGKNDICNFLIMNGANIEEENEKCTPLHGACIRGHKDTALMLISKGASRLMLLNLL